MIQLELWQKIALYIALLTSLYIYVKTSRLTINGVPFLRLKYRIILAIFFPLVFLGALLIGSAILALALVTISLLALYSLVTKKKISVKITRTIPKKPLD